MVYSRDKLLERYIFSPYVVMVHIIICCYGTYFLVVMVHILMNYHASIDIALL